MVIYIFLIITIILFILYIDDDVKVITLTINDKKFDDKKFDNEKFDNETLPNILIDKKYPTNIYNTYPYLKYVDWNKERRMSDSLTYEL